MKIKLRGWYFADFKSAFIDMYELLAKLLIFSSKHEFLVNTEIYTFSSQTLSGALFLFLFRPAGGFFKPDGFENPSTIWLVETVFVSSTVCLKQYYSTPAANLRQTWAVTISFFWNVFEVYSRILLHKMMTFRQTWV